jgi:H+/gluconate symporter-like permease
MPMPAALSAVGHEHAHHMAAPHTSAIAAANALAVGVHTLTYLGVMALAAWIVYRKLGLNLLRRAWLNMDWVWAGALVVTGIVVLLK